MPFRFDIGISQDCGGNSFHVSTKSWELHSTLHHVIDVLSRLVSVHGAPRFLRSDNGPEFVSRAVLRWLSSSNIDTALIDPGKPWQNATNESFNDKFRDECLSLEWFRSRAEAKVLIEIWRRHYNGVRPHSSPGYLTPKEFINRSRSDHSGAVL